MHASCASAAQRLPLGRRVVTQVLNRRVAGVEKSPAMLRRICAGVLLAFAAAGCANHVRFSNEVREHESREVTRADTRIAAPAALALPYVELALTSEETLSVRRRETLVKLDDETPWRARDELWEVPS